uniref:Chromo domain-containing protein n=1 Tax=Haptolina ericina TaxID=156174 RepID=A0A6T9DB64_9EUKA
MTELGGSGRGEVGGIACEIRLGGQGGGGQGCGGCDGGGGRWRGGTAWQTIGEDGAVEGVREVGMSAVAELKDRRKGPAGVEVLVAWEGVDAATGLGWPDSWIPEVWRE